MLSRVETLWTQRAKTQWFDRNTNIFPFSSFKEGKAKSGFGTKGLKWVLQHDLNVIGGIALEYFKGIFSSSQQDEQSIENVTTTS
ncbi:hypothetical protein OROHE_021933 [Orobanche hederae]